MNPLPIRPCRPLAAAVLLLAAGLQTGPAQAQAPTTAVPFLQIEPDSRAVGRGLTGVAVADDAGAIFWNPAGLAAQAGTGGAFTHAPWLPDLGADLSFEYLAGRHHVEGVGTFAGHLTYLDLGEQQRTDDDGNALGTFRSYDLAVGASFGRALTPALAVGGGLRLVRSSLAGGTAVNGVETRAATAVAADLGVLYRPPALADGRVRPALGLALANMGPAVRYTDADDGHADPIPTNLRLGAAVAVDLDATSRVTWALDANRLLVDRDSAGRPAPFYEALFSAWGGAPVDRDGAGPMAPVRLGALRQFTVGTGLEYWYDDLLALRTGFFYEDPANGNRQFLTFGAGLRYHVVGVDLAYIHAVAEGSPLGGQVYLSLSLTLPP